MPLRSLVATLTAGLAAAATALAAAGPVHADAPRGHACSSAVAIERYSDVLDKTTYAGTFVGNLSGLAVDRDGSLLAVSDRSALFTLDRRTLAPRGVIPLITETGAALDAEALAVDRDGTRIVASETEPSLRRYDRRGRFLGSLPVPDDAVRDGHEVLVDDLGDGLDGVHAVLHVGVAVGEDGDRVVPSAAVERADAVHPPAVCGAGQPPVLDVHLHGG
ncbi:esterase-like activity of phytase family protein, partial [Streptomyces caniscabiei]|uniref:esterase-like activity of phytase family protein n=1 Tax=Streptomyces caniscabiei TaxID=2746961 RepID=UPI00211B256F